jgi:lambda family phage tail tape measure protein
MADLVYKVSVDTKQAQKSLDNLDKSIGGLKNALAGLAIGSFIANTFRSAEAIQDLAEQTGFATQTILGLRRAFQENGGSAEGANEAISKFTKNIGEAAAGSANLQRSFQEVGVSLQDLATLSEEDLFLKTIKGLGSITDQATKAKLASELLGKSAKANFTGIANSVDSFIAGSAAAARANENANRAVENFDRGIANLKEQLLIVLDPISKLASNINVAGERFAAFLNIVKNVAVVVGTFFVIGKAVKALILVIGALAKAPLLVVAGVNSLIRTWKIFLEQLGRFKQAGEITQKTITGLSTRFKFLKEGIDFVAKGVGILVAALTGLASIVFPESVSNFLSSLGQGLGVVQDEAEASANAIDELNKKSYEQHKALREERQKQRDVIVAVEEKIAAIRQVGIAYQKQNNEIIKAVQNEEKYLSLTNDQVELQRQLDDFTLKYKGTLAELEAQRSKLTAAQKEERQAINDTIATTFKAFLADEKRLKSAIESLQKARQAEEEFARSIENTGRELQKLSALADLQEELSLIGLYGDELEKQTRLNEINRNLRQEQQQLAIELLRLDKDRNKIGELNYNAERQRIIKQMADAVELSEARIATFEEEQKRKTELENSYAEGAKRALQDMAEQMKPLTVAQDAVKRGFDALGNAIDDFVETGKFSFKQFAASVIADIAKIVAKALVLQAIKTIFGGFGIPGLAEGGPAKAGKPYIVGEKGPELFVPKTSGTVVPNNAMKNGVATGAVNAPVTNNYNTYNINAVDAKSVAQLFAENRKVLLGTVKMAERELPYMA